MNEPFSRFLQSLRAFRRTSVGAGIAAILALLTIIDTLSGFKLVPSAYALLVKADLRYFIAVGFCILGAIAIRPPTNVKLRVALACIGIALCLPAVTYISQPQPGELLIVYDKHAEQMYPASLPVRAVNLQDVNKLFQVGEIGSDNLILSVVEGPEKKWSPVFTSQFKPTKKILSIREVLAGESSHFIDISASDFKQEMLTVLRENEAQCDLVVIYFQREYLNAASALDKRIRAQCSRVTVTLVAYQDKSTGLLHPENSIVVYLGSPELFSGFVRRISTTEFGLLIAPNWIIGEVDVRPRNETGRKLVAISSPALRLATADYRQWTELLATIREAEQQEGNFKDFVESRLLRGSTAHKVGFAVTDLKH